MKTCLWLTLLSLSAVAYGARISPQVSIQKPVLSKDDAAAVVLKAVKSLQNVGRLLQGDVALTKEEQKEVFEVLSALTNEKGALSGEDAEYSLPVITHRSIFGAVAHRIKMWFQKLA